jgi:hypothetical protein
MSAYNFYFKSERARLLSDKASVECATGEAAPDKAHLSGAGPDDTKPKLGFANLARGVAARWKMLDSTAKVWFEESARLDKLRYQTELAVWKANQVKIQSALCDESGSSQSQGDIQPVQKVAPFAHLKVVTPEKKASCLGNKDTTNHIHPLANQSDRHETLALNSQTSSQFAPSLPYSIATTSPGFASLAQVQSPLCALMESCSHWPCPCARDSSLIQWSHPALQLSILCSPRVWIQDWRCSSNANCNV